MNRREYIAVIRVLEKIDRGAVAPRLSGAIGRFFRSYAASRLAIGSIALETGVMPGRDGAIRFGDTGVATLRFLDGIADWDETPTEFGVLYHIPALCDELLTSVTLRLWSTTGAGAEGLYNLVNVRLLAQGIRLEGNFEWKPLSIVLPYRAAYRLVDIPGDPQWIEADYLRYVGEDIGIDPHPLSYTPIVAGGTHLFAALRIVDGLPLDRNTIGVLFAGKRGFLQVPIRTTRATTSHARTLIEERKPACWLIASEPNDEGWTVLDGRNATGSDFVLHARAWGLLLDSLRPETSIPSQAEISGWMANNLTLIGLSNPPEVPLRDPRGTKAGSFAARMAEQIRFPTRRRSIRLLEG